MLQLASNKTDLEEMLDELDINKDGGIGAPHRSHSTPRNNSDERRTRAPTGHASPRAPASLASQTCGSFASTCKSRASARRTRSPTGSSTRPFSSSPRTRTAASTCDPLCGSNPRTAEQSDAGSATDACGSCVGTGGGAQEDHDKSNLGHAAHSRGVGRDVRAHGAQRGGKHEDLARRAARARVLAAPARRRGGGRVAQEMMGVRGRSEPPSPGRAHAGRTRDHLLLKCAGRQPLRAVPVGVGV